MLQAVQGAVKKNYITLIVFHYQPQQSELSEELLSRSLMDPDTTYFIYAMASIICQRTLKSQAG